MNFKDQIAADLTVFINPNEFGEFHNVDGRQLLIVISKDATTGRQRKGATDYYSMTDGIHVSTFKVYAFASDFPVVPEADSNIEIDGQFYRVVNCDNQMGVLEIELEGNQT
ncbi:hypothetical protein [Brevibacillus brevis]|uniref:hypothetical protein n=1 Tax=Brevibacillus brevis TaxID=1393 RepID=UPI001C8D4927|nr:hypothetical protein [Brevibacillus brevis]MBY0088114.1 hypothetical protein [Brevibacillus brevis]